MKRFGIVILYIAAGCIFFGTVIAVSSYSYARNKGIEIEKELANNVFFNNWHFDFSNGFEIENGVRPDFYEEAEYRKTEISETFTDLTISCVNQNVEIAYGNGSSATVEFYERFDGDFKPVEVRGGKLYIEESPIQNNVFDTRWTLPSDKNFLRVTLPQGTKLINADADTVNGSILIENQSIETLRIDNVNGALYISKGKIERIDYTTVNGEYRVSKTDFNELMVNGVNAEGHLDLLGNESEYSFNADAVAADFNIAGNSYGNSIQKSGTNATRHINVDSVSGGFDADFEN